MVMKGPATQCKDVFPCRICSVWILLFRKTLTFLIHISLFFLLKWLFLMAGLRYMCRHSLSFYWSLSFLSCICISCGKGHLGLPLSHVSRGNGPLLNIKARGQRPRVKMPPQAATVYFWFGRIKYCKKIPLEFVLLKWTLLYRRDFQKAV